MALSIRNIASQIPGYSENQVRRIAGPTVTQSEASALKAGNPGRVNKAECKTCKERKYKDGSDENVSFKSAQHISPTEAGSRVRAHEQEHVSNAYSKASKDGGKVLQASVAIHTAICPECGRTYISGGTTSTRIQYPNEKNPYQAGRKNSDRLATEGMNFDKTV
ncbi:MAG: hypothetical protein K5871_08485 [Lachnospiraceae bacterium]|nr:hypothetical protein [Lachnospiraceae bacterium]